MNPQALNRYSSSLADAVEAVIGESSSSQKADGDAGVHGRRRRPVLFRGTESPIRDLE
jgi:hypothetical protein